MPEDHGTKPSLNPLIIREELQLAMEVGFEGTWSLNPLIIREELQRKPNVKTGFSEVS